MNSTPHEFFPILSESGQAMLKFLREHASAPVFTNTSGHRLTLDDLRAVQAFEHEVAAAQPGWPRGREPNWLQDYCRDAIAQVPAYRTYAQSSLEQLPTTCRADLSRDIAQFVPDDQALEGLIQFNTSGTTGHSLLVPSRPQVAANYLAWHKKALARFGIHLTHGRGQVGVVLMGWQKRCFTYASVTPSMQESGLVKLNLHPDDWRHPDDRVKYLDALAAEVWTGDPVAFAELAKLPLQSKPRVMLSTSMALLPAMRQHLEARFACPLLDLYSMNEAGPIAVYDAELGGHVLLQHRLFVEILQDGQRVGPGERGEVTLTGGFNPCLPLLRYRTGDQASLQYVAGEIVLMDLEGRPPVRYSTAQGQWLNNIELTHAMRHLALSQFAVHQRADRSLQVRYHGNCAADTVRQVLQELLGDLPMEVEQLPHARHKLVQYTSQLDGAQELR